jgi:hypothetical protein
MTILQHKPHLWQPSSLQLQGFSKLQAVYSRTSSRAQLGESCACATTKMVEKLGNRSLKPLHRGSVSFILSGKVGQIVTNMYLSLNIVIWWTESAGPRTQSSRYVRW